MTHPSPSDRAAVGRAARKKTPRSAHAGWDAPAARPDPVELLIEQDAGREPDLVPVRHGRMMVSPFTFYRGAARVMAADLAATPVAGLNAQLCGDAHISNFGLFASPERNLLFDLNDFDETLAGPFEWDVKRLGTSLVVAARNNGFDAAEQRNAVLTTIGAYRQAMGAFARMPMLDIWYSRLDSDRLLEVARTTPARAQVERMVGRARTKDNVQALDLLAERVNGRYRIISQPPLIVPLRDMGAELDPEGVRTAIRDQFRAYRASLEPDRRTLIERYEFVDLARKVVGVGSVGMRALIVLLHGRDEADPLFLQLKEATYSVLEEFLPKSRYRHHGQRVVVGQRMMQAASDIFLGWTSGVDTTRHFYWRQLRDMKGSVEVERLDPTRLAGYGAICGWTLARAHARTGDAIAIASYLGKKDPFDRAIADFAERYADQNERDYQAFADAVTSDRIEAVEGL